ncbi:MAG: 3-isopropylmalate dehydratase [Candidatus Aminicenantes bacterium]|nr:3-isopropylmalate dehydratase [Candidatus Aminicenantes bacterium]
MVIHDKVLAKLGDNIATEMITASAYVTSSEPEELGKIACKGIDPDFVNKMRPGGILVAGKNFGCSSSREWAPVALKAAGVKLVLAEFFARIFYRNAINIGLPIVECQGISEKLSLGDEAIVDLVKGEVEIVKSGEKLSTIPMPKFLIERIEKGGLIPQLAEEFCR